MPVIRIQHTKWREGQAGEAVVVAGQLQVSGRVASYPAGSFGLRGLRGFVFTPANPTVKRTVVGSISDPVNDLGNTIQLNAVITGSTGTRSTTMATIGSMAGAGTIASGHFIAWGR